MKNYNITNFYKSLYSTVSKNISNYNKGAVNDIEHNNIKCSQDFKNAIDETVEIFHNHPAYNHKLFQYLEDQKSKGFNKNQFQIYRDNFFYRTELTIPSVASTVIAAIKNSDYITVSQMAKNLYDEGGYGDPNKVHAKLLLDSHNLHGEKIFNLQPVRRIKDIENSDYITNETKNYRSSKMNVFNESYSYVIGNAWAHEFLADGMLENFKNAFFVPYRGYYNPKDYEKVIEFYKAHRDDEKEGGDVEAEHERMARDSVVRSCDSDIKKYNEVLRGGLEFMSKQSNLWDSMLSLLEKNQKSSEVIPTKEAFSDSISNTNIATKLTNKNTLQK